MDIGYTLSGFIVGLIVGLTGVGGGSLMTPILVVVFGIKPAIAVGTDLLYAAITKSGGVFVHHRQQTIEWKVVGLLALGSVPTALVTIAVLKALTAKGINYENVMTTTLGVALILTALVLLFKNQLLQIGRHEKLAAVKAMHRQLQTPITVAAGAILGVLVTLSSVGAGALGAAVLFFLYPRYPAVSIVGTDIAHAVPLTAVAGLGHAHLGTVDYSLLVSLLLGSLPGIVIGSRFAVRLPDRLVRSLLASMLLLIGLRFAL
ncbi:MAG: sulfite exporter TauE/SafE family protein [Gammaproteobacteria bacterium]